MRLLIIFSLLGTAIVVSRLPELIALGERLVPSALVVPVLLTIYTWAIVGAAWQRTNQVVAKVDLASLRPQDIAQIEQAVRFISDLPVQHVHENLKSIVELRQKIEAANASAKQAVTSVQTLRGQLKGLESYEIENFSEAAEKALIGLRQIAQLNTDGLDKIEDIIDEIQSGVNKVQDLVGGDGDELDDFSDHIDKVIEAKEKLDELFEKDKP